MATRSFVMTESRVETDDDSDAFGFRGYASVFNALSEDLGGFREQFAPESFNRTLSNGSDVRMLADHDAARVLARTTAGTLRLSVDDRGLRASADMAPVSYARDLKVLLERGDVNQMSIGFRAIEDDWTTDDQGELVRTVREAHLLEVSTVAFPAYRQTTAEARSVADGLEQLVVDERSDTVDLDQVREVLDRLGRTVDPAGISVARARRRLATAQM